MSRFLQYSLAGCFLASTAILILSQDNPSRGNTQSLVDQLPIIQPATHKPYTESIAGSNSTVSFDMVAIPGGTYLMGSPDSEKEGKKEERPRHPVTVRPFWMGKTEVTWDEYDLYWKKDENAKPPEAPADKAADAVSRPTPPYADETFGHGREHHPVLCISHHSAMEYCRWLSAKTGKTYRLPTEAEWEFAARAGTKNAYFFGDDPKSLGDYAWYNANSEDLTHEVGKKKPNPWGLYDIYGNVAEWCLDTYKENVYAAFQLNIPAVTPVLIPSDVRFPHVARGGSWADEPDKLRSAARRGSDKNWIKRDPQRPQSIWWLTDAEFVGFRIVRPVEEQKELVSLRSMTTRQSK
jgi:formylglycine-generating enzyme required for sulfatase activity